MSGRGKGGTPKPGLPTQAVYPLDRISTGDIKRDRDLAERLLAFHWKYYTELAFQRWQARDEIRRALHEAARDRFEFKAWQRVVRYKRSLAPLSSAGSLTDPGGRFNLGDIDRPRFPAFPALYLAENKEIALQEALAQASSNVVKQAGVELTALDMALAKPDSILFASVSGLLDSYIDLSDPQRLQPLIEIIREFAVSGDVRRMARALRLPPPGIISRLDQLRQELLKADWRAYPIQVDAPSNSRIFGQMVKEAGIDGIVFPSKFGDGRCLAMFPELLADSDSYAQLDDQPPDATVIRRLDRTTWKALT